MGSLNVCQSGWGGSILAWLSQSCKCFALKIWICEFFCVPPVSLCRLYRMASVAEECVDSSSLALLDQCTKEQLLLIAENCELEIPDKKLKESVKFSLRAGLMEKGILEPVVGVCFFRFNVSF